MVVAEGLAALRSLKSIYDIAKDVRESHDPEKLRAAAAQMFDLALAAREQTAALQEERNTAVTELAALKAEIEKHEAFDRKAADMVMRQDPHSHAFVYRQKPAAGEQSKPPNYCPHCFENKKLSILQPAKDANHRLGVFNHECPGCNVKMPLAGRG